MKSAKLMNLIFFLTAAMILVMDQYTKSWIKSTLPASNSMEVFPNLLYITHVKNTGAAFGLFQEGTTVLTIISMVAIVLIVIIKIMVKLNSYFFNISLGLILGGALGNLIDRFFIGEVTDFIHFVYFPVFNVADSSIVVGFIIVIILLFREFFKKSDTASN
ncbi:MAG: signal peptidase II [Actinomycetota bacterium]